MIRRLRGESLANFDDNLPLTAFRDLRKAIEVLNEAGLYGPLLIQIYSTIDIMASLARPEYRPEVIRGVRFLERARDDFDLRDSFNDELQALRVGTYTAPTRLTGGHSFTWVIHKPLKR